jgi:hypothetical protein
VLGPGVSAAASHPSRKNNGYDVALEATALC